MENSRLNVKSSRRKRSYFRVEYSDEEPNQISSSEPNKDRAGNYAVESECDSDPKLNNTQPTHSSPLQSDRYSGGWEPESDNYAQAYKSPRYSPSATYYDYNSGDKLTKKRKKKKKKKNPATADCHEEESDCDSINQKHINHHEKPISSAKYSGEWEPEPEPEPDYNAQAYKSPRYSPSATYYDDYSGDKPTKKKNPATADCDEEEIDSGSINQKHINHHENPIQSAKYSGEWEPEPDYNAQAYKSPRYSPSATYYADHSGDKLTQKKKKNPATADCDEEKIDCDSINQKGDLLFDYPGFRYKVEQQLHELYPVEPQIRAAWAGVFTVSNRQNTRTTFQGLNACLSTKACPAARFVVEQMPPSIRWEKLPRCCVWPKAFKESVVGGPTPHDIGVFFFPSVTKHAAAYDSLLFDLIRDDMALRTSVLGSELLLFTSIELPPPSRRFQGSLFLWGVFRGNQPPL